MATGKFSRQAGGWVVRLDEQPDVNLLEHLTNVTNQTDNFPVEVNFIDPRQARPQQRALFFALLHDIWEYTGQPEDYLKDYFYSRFTIKTNGKAISLANGTKSTVTDATYLIDDVIDFIFEYSVPIKLAYRILPRSESRFQFNCLKHRRCVVCGRKADVHHTDEIGMGRDRTKIDHTKHHLMALCRTHHTELHQVGKQVFGERYKLTMTGIKASKELLKQINVKGRCDDKNQ